MFLHKDNCKSIFCGANEKNSFTNRKNNSSKGQEQITMNEYHKKSQSSDTITGFSKGLVISEAVRLPYIVWGGVVFPLLRGNISLRF